MRTRLTLLIILILTVFSISLIHAQEDTITTLEFEGILDRVAESFDISLECLMEVNNLDNFQSEGALSIDSTCPAYDVDDDAEASDEDLGQGGGITEYTIAQGDRLADIAEEFGVTVDCIQSANTIADPNLIFVGQELVIDDTCGAVSDGSISNTNLEVVTATGECLGDRNAGRVVDGAFYTVQAGDILDFIACDLNLSTACLIESNSSLQDRRKSLAIGQQLNVNNCDGWEGPYNSGRLNG